MRVVGPSHNESWDVGVDNHQWIYYWLWAWGSNWTSGVLVLGYLYIFRSTNRLPSFAPQFTGKTVLIIIIIIIINLLGLHKWLGLQMCFSKGQVQDTRTIHKYENNKVVQKQINTKQHWVKKESAWWQHGIVWGLWSVEYSKVPSSTEKESW